MNHIIEFFRRLGGKLGLSAGVAGFIFIFLGWNGAASYDSVPEQFPWLISGGIAGLGLVVLGAAFLVVESARKERAELQATLLEIREGLERVTATSGTIATTIATEPGMVVAGSASYHRPNCHLVAGREDLEVIAIQQAEEQGLAPCRVCDPRGLSENGPRSRRQLRARSS